MVNSVEYSRLDKLRILKFVYEEIKAYSGQEIKVSSIWRKAEEKRIVTNKLTTIKHQ